LTANVNPFMEGPTRDADPDADGFGVVGGEEPDPDGEVVEAVVDGADADDEEDEEAADGDAEADATDDDAVTVGLDDLRAEYDAADDEEATAEEAAASDDGGTVAVEEDAADPAEREDDESVDNEIEVEPTTAEASMSQHDPEPASEREQHDVRPDASAWREDVDSGGWADAQSDEAVALAGLADTYATEIIVFEWLTSLVSTAGPAATLRAVAYYEEIGWISPRVKTYLESVISGPDLDMNVDPSRDPNELTAEDHAESYEYIMKLDAVQRTIDDTGL
jgi:archaellum component FlaD/FlaE